MAAKQPGIIQEAQTTNDDIPLPNWEESLLSLEKLDRTSPEIWPEPIPGISGFAPLQDPKEVPPPWHRGLSNDDIAYMQQLGTLSTTSLIMEVKKLHDLAYQLGLEEAKEMTRGKYLNIFSSKRQRLHN
ncbi:Protein lin-52 homolog [Eumeta japonica]|uniref:Protein lin-52 homolog n=1 Tax=Eumeta variegata TaxID=151549 RepID=A0A4C1UAU0_EUMVA|nr:Protein lin-52 homolog [Eumeta japonica]